MSKHSHQDYVAKIRYNNDLPPPPCPPKLLNYADVEDPKDIEKSTFLTSVFRKENFRSLVTLDNNLGMQMNLLAVPDALEKNQVDAVCSLGPEYGNGQNLHPADQLLLADPSRSTTVKGEAVAFLRRTQYIQADKTLLPARYTAGNAVEQSKETLQRKRQLKKEGELNPKEQLRSVEAMFGSTLIEDDLSKLHHPVKKKLRAKRVWNLLPDTSMMDSKFYDIKFSSSASVRKGKNTKEGDIKSENDPRLLTAMLREIELNPETTLVSFYATSEDEAVEIKKQIDDQTENAPISEEEAAHAAGTAPGAGYTYKKMRDLDGRIKPYGSGEELRHLAISFDDKTSTALYVPIEGRVELKKCRIDPYLEPKVRELSYDQVYLSIREPTRAEIDERDALRSTYDPMEFGSEGDA